MNSTAFGSTLTAPEYEQFLVMLSAHYDYELLR